MKNDRRLNVIYFALQGLYWMSYGIAMSFAAVFLQGIGYSNKSLGAIVALGHILGFLLSNTLGTLVDKYEKMTVTRTVTVILIVNAVFTFINSRIHSCTPVTWISYPLFVALTVSVNPMIIKLWADIDHQGRKVNFGYARAFGSFAFVMITTFLGRLIVRAGVGIMPYLSLGIIALQLLFIRLIANEFDETARPLDRHEKISALSLADFIRNNRRFMVLMTGLSVVFLSHYITGSFLINIVKNIGGDTASLGYVSGYMAFLEVPVFILYTFLKKRISVRKILRISIIMFIPKALGLALAPSMPMLFLLYLLHVPSYALFIPAIVDYVKEVIPHEDSAKGQSLASNVTTVGSVFAGFIGGALYDSIGVTSTALSAVAISVLGVAVSMFGIKKSE